MDIKISNNLFESDIRPFSAARSSWLFTDTSEDTTTIAYTLSESARVNELNVIEYFNHILTQILNNNLINYPEK